MNGSEPHPSTGETWTQPAVTVVLLADRSSASLLPAIRSVLDQTFAWLELLVLNTGGADGAVASAGAFLGDPRVRFLLASGRRRADHLNCALAESRGRYLARIASDERWPNDRLHRQVLELRAHPDQLLAQDPASKAEADRVRGIARLRTLTVPAVRSEERPAVLLSAAAARAAGGYRGGMRSAERDLIRRLSRGDGGATVGVSAAGSLLPAEAVVGDAAGWS
jgi:glycosyltransferase involved in cell wall biosynthesis